MKSTLKFTIFSLSFLTITLTSCSDETAKKSTMEKAMEANEAKGDGPLSVEEAVTSANSKFASWVMKNMKAARLGDTPELDKLADEAYKIDQEFKKAMLAHPDLADLVKAKNEPGISNVEGFTRLGKILEAANDIPELRAMKDKYNQAELARIKETANQYEKAGQKEIAKTLRDIIDRIK